MSPNRRGSLDRGPLAPQVHARFECCRCRAEVSTRLSRVLSRVLKEFLPVFSTVFECFC
jgi:hypothetical protein